MTRKRPPEPENEPTLDRALPHNLEAERSILGAILIHNDAFERVSEILRPEHFYRHAHALLFAAMATVIDDQNVNCDFVTLKEELTRRGELDEIGGPAYIAALVDGLPHATNVRYYADIVHEKATLRGIIKTASRTLSAAYDAEQSAHDILNEADRALLDLQVGGNRRGLVDVRVTAGSLIADLEERVARKGQLWGIDSGFKSINEETMGWQPGDMIVIAARPSVGKTTFALNSALAAARSGKHVAIFSLEMRRKQLDFRMLSGLSGVPSRRMMSGYLTETEYAHISRGLMAYSELPIFINDRSGQTIGDIRMACRRLKSEHGLDLVMIDYVQLIPGTVGRRGASRNEEITDISLRTKALAGELNVPVFLVSQLKRTGGNRPTLEDLRESGSLEQDADMVCFLHRKNHKEGGLTNFIIEKARNGPTGTVNLSLDRDTTTFTDAGEQTVEQRSQAELEMEQAARTKAIIRSRARKAH
jgi:replicative DNA helicase